MVYRVMLIDTLTINVKSHGRALRVKATSTDYSECKDSISIFIDYRVKSYQATKVKLPEKTTICKQRINSSFFKFFCYTLYERAIVQQQSPRIISQ